MSAKRLSIIVPSLNRHEQLSRIVNKIIEFSTSETEVIVVDDSIERWTDFDGHSYIKNEIKYVHRGRKLGVSSARNSGAKQAHGDYLLFLDDDDDFTENWIADFIEATKSKPDFIFCQMKRIEPNGQENIVTGKKRGNGGRGNAIVIPGAWVIKKKVFESINGYDEKLTYAENTELIIRLESLQIDRRYIESPNFIYFPSPDGGSKNLQNMVDSLTHILDKHQKTLSPHVKHLYYQIIGVNYLRFRRFGCARTNLAWSIFFKPWKIATWGRFGIACFPFLAKKLYSEKVSYV